MYAMLYVWIMSKYCNYLNLYIKYYILIYLTSTFDGNCHLVIHLFVYDNVVLFS